MARVGPQPSRRGGKEPAHRVLLGGRRDRRRTGGAGAQSGRQRRALHGLRARYDARVHRLRRHLGQGNAGGRRRGRGVPVRRPGSAEEIDRRIPDQVRVRVRGHRPAERRARPARQAGLGDPGRGRVHGRFGGGLKGRFRAADLGRQGADHQHPQRRHEPVQRAGQRYPRGQKAGLQAPAHHLRRGVGAGAVSAHLPNPAEALEPGRPGRLARGNPRHLRRQCRRGAARHPVALDRRLSIHRAAGAARGRARRGAALDRAARLRWAGRGATPQRGGCLDQDGAGAAGRSSQQNRGPRARRRFRAHSGPDGHVAAGDRRRPGATHAVGHRASRHALPPAGRGVVHALRCRSPAARSQAGRGRAAFRAVVSRAHAPDEGRAGRPLRRTMASRSGSASMGRPARRRIARCSGRQSPTSPATARR